MKKGLLIVAAILLVFTLAGQAVFAFNDVKDDPNGSKITELEKLGVVSGSGKNGHFKPKEKLTYAEGISMIVKGLQLNIDNIRFIKEPKASDYFTRVDDNAWYAGNFIIASLNNLGVPKDVNPKAYMTREQFAHHLFQGLMRKGSYAFIEMYVTVNDEKSIAPAYMDSIQKLLLAKIIELDKQNNFNPKTNVTRGTAAGWLYDTIQFVKTHEPSPGDGQTQSFPLYDVKLSVAPVNSQINEVTVSAKAPHAGYSFVISSITFEGDKAVIHLEAVYPDKDKVYAQVITDVKQTTYVASSYKVVLGDSYASTGAAAAASEGGAAVNN